MEEEEKQKEENVADVLKEMQATHEAEIASKNAEIERLKAEHAKELRDVLLGRNEAFNKERDERDVVKQLAQKIKKNLGI